MMMIKLLRVN